VAIELRREVDARIDALIDTTTPPADVYVNWVAALDVATCPRRYRLSGEDGWGFPGWSPTLAAGAVGRAALLHHLRADVPPARLPQPVAAVRAWMRSAGQGHIDTRVADWVADLVRAGERGTLAATAALASRWLAGFLRVLGWPLPERLGVVTDDPDDPIGRRWTRTYRPSGDVVDNVVIASSPDAVLGRVTPSGGYSLVVHRTSSPGDAMLADRAAFEATAAALVTGVVPDGVRFTAGDTDENLSVPAADAVLARGMDLMAGVVRQRVIATGAAAGDDDDATPSAACHYCPALDGCRPGQSWRDGPGRWHGGLPALPRSELADRAVPAAQLPVR
jgi:hypothetical protein